MTKVLLQYGSPAPDGSYPPVEGVLIWTPTRRRVIQGSPDKIIMPIGFKVPIHGGVIEVNVAPNGIDWVWRVDELVKGANRVISYKAVPDQETVDFTELVSVDPLSLQPIATPEPVWYSWVEGLALSAANAEADAEASKLAATDSQTSAQASASAAAISASEASSSRQVAEDKAAQAGTSAFNAATSAATALGHKNDAEAAEYEAVQAKNVAIGARDSAQGYLGSMVIDGLVDVNGHLILEKTNGSTSDAGSVIGPPINLTITDTVTGPETPGIVGPQGPIGPKGDPGGFTTGTALSTSNLNTILTPGIYIQSNGALVLTSANYPMNYNAPGVLTVYTNGSTGLQEWRTSYAAQAGRVTFRRTWSQSGGNFTSWQATNSTRVDQTAGRAIYQWDDINSREQLIFGDTGWRDMWADVIAIDPAATKVAGFLGARIRRTLQHVHLDIGFNTSYQVGTFDWRPIIMPNTSWRPDTPVNWQIPASVTGSSGIIHFSPANYVRQWTAGNIILQMTLPCSATWPASLPGVASGNIPNI